MIERVATLNRLLNPLEDDQVLENPTLKSEVCRFAKLSGVRLATSLLA